MVKMLQIRRVLRIDHGKDRRLHPRDVLWARQPMVAVAHQSEHDIVGRQEFHEFERVTIGDVGIGHALQDMHRATSFDDARQHAVEAAVLDQGAGEDVGLWAVFRGFLEIAALGKGIVDPALIQKALVSPASKFEIDPRKIIAPARAMQAYQVKLGSLEKELPFDGLFETQFYERALKAAG